MLSAIKTVRKQPGPILLFMLLYHGCMVLGLTPTTEISEYLRKSGTHIKSLLRFTGLNSPRAANVVSYFLPIFSISCKISCVLSITC